MKSENAFVTELFEKYHDQLKRYCMRYVRYNARYYPLVDDCIQEAFYKAVLHQNDVMQSPNPYGWLAKCCENYLKSKYRQEKRRAEILVETSAMTIVEKWKILKTTFFAGYILMSIMNCLQGSTPSSRLPRRKFFDITIGRISHCKKQRKKLA